MLPVTQTSMVRLMCDRRVNGRQSEDLRAYLRAEFGGDGAEVSWVLSRPAKAARATVRAEKRGLLSALFEALGAAFPSPGGA